MRSHSATEHLQFLHYLCSAFVVTAIYESELNALYYSNQSMPVMSSASGVLLELNAFPTLNCTCMPSPVSIASIKPLPTHMDPNKLGV